MSILLCPVLDQTYTKNIWQKHTKYYPSKCYAGQFSMHFHRKGYALCNAYLYSGLLKSGLSLKLSQPKTHSSANAHPTGNVSPTTHHCRGK